MAVGVNENGFPVHLEGTREGLTGVGNDAVGNFEAVDIGLVLLIAAESIADGARRKTEHSEQQEKRGKRGPVVEGADAPGRAGAREKRADGAVAQIGKNEKNRGKEQESLPE